MSINRFFSGAPPLLRDFLTYLSTIRGKSDKTAQEYFLDLRMFFRFLKRERGLVPANMDFDAIPIADVDPAFLREVTLSETYAFLDFVAHERPRQPSSPATAYGLGPAARARKTTAIRVFFRYLTDKAAVLEYNPVANLEAPARRKSLPRYLTLEESMALLEHVDGPFAERDYCILTLFLNCGLRVSELVGINLTDIREGTLRVLGKGNKERMLFLNEACLTAVDRYLPHRLTPHARDQKALFVSKQRNRIGVQTVKWLVKKYLTSAGLDTAKYSAHKLRHTAATLMYQNGVDVRTLQTVLGHANLDTTMIYTHINDDNLRQAAACNPLAHITRTAAEEPREED